MSRHVPEQYHKWYSLNYKKKMESVYKRRQIIADWFKNLKLSKKCKTCKAVPDEKTLRKFHFHHKNPDEKLTDVSTLVHKGYSLKIIKEELKKCQFLCSDCHADLTFG